ncbi:MAG: PEP-CTERM sorting domain-containing protein [Planctomycetota bacterium]
MRVTLFRSLCAATLLAFASQAGASTMVLVDEDFAYADGDLAANAAWNVHSGLGGSGGPLLVESEVAVIQHGVPDEDNNTSIGMQTSGQLTVAFDITVSDTDGIWDTGDDEYFLSLGASGLATTLPGRVYLIAPTMSGDFSIGVRSSSGGSIVGVGSDFSFDTAISVELFYDIDTNTASLSVNGGPTAFGDVVGFDNNVVIDDVSLRQSDSENNETIRLDNLLVTRVPEPGSVVLFLLGSAMAGAARMRRVLG